MLRDKVSKFKTKFSWLLGIDLTGVLGHENPSTTRILLQCYSIYI